jgi:hypothetical protein
MYGKSIALRQQLDITKLLSDATSLQNATIVKNNCRFISLVIKIVLEFGKRVQMEEFSRCSRHRTAFRPASSCPGLALQ